jgi:hypothetical protein
MMMMKMAAVLSVVLLLASRVDLVSSRGNVVVNTAEAVDHPTEGSGTMMTEEGRRKKKKRKKTPLELAYAQVDWAVSKGGSFNHKKVIIKPTSLEDNNNNNLGLYAAGEIGIGNIIMKIPRSTILSNGKLRYVLFCLFLSALTGTCVCGLRVYFFRTVYYFCVLYCQFFTINFVTHMVHLSLCFLQSRGYRGQM